MYSASDHAKAHLDDAERDRLFAEANDEFNRQVAILYGAQGSIMPTAASILAQLGKTNPFREMADILSQVRQICIEHADAARLRDLIEDCVAVCKAVSKANDRHRRGQKVLDEVDELVQRYSHLTKTAKTVLDSIFELIRSGKLVVRNGKVIRAAP
jgi:hypothetical protein